MALDLIEPQVPDAQRNAGPALFAQSLGTGLAAFARFAQLKRDSESEMLKLAQQERLAQDAHDLEKQKLANDYELHDRAMTINEELLPYRQRYLESLGETRKNATMQVLQFNQQRADLVNEANADAEKLGLNNPQFPVKNPVEFAANSLKFESQWGYGKSTIPEINVAISRYQTIRDQHKITLPSYAKRNEDGELIAGKPQQIPIYRVVEGLQNPDTHDQFRDILEASGHLTSEEKEVPGEAKKSKLHVGEGLFSATPVAPVLALWNMFVDSPPPTKKVKTDVPDATAARLIDQSRSVDFSPLPSKLPAAMIPRSSGKGVRPTSLPSPDLPTDSSEPDASSLMNDPQAAVSKAFDPTQTDLYIQHAKNAIAQGAPAAEVAQRLQENFGIDPAALWAA